MNNPTFWWHVAEVFIGVVILGAVTFSIVRPNSTQKTVVQSGGTAVYQWKDAQVKPGFGGCVTIAAQKPQEIK